MKLAQCKNRVVRNRVFRRNEKDRIISWRFDSNSEILARLENQTEKFDELSVYNSAQNIRGKSDLPNARDYLKSVLVNEEDVKLISVFGV